jgi:hypothetical protein
VAAETFVRWLHRPRREGNRAAQGETRSCGAAGGRAMAKVAASDFAIASLRLQPSPAGGSSRN